ncbi:MAG: zeta toxin family protein [Lachnospiraceae bacterium]|nr:zeta toxin family protein [Lachnospiraceae bacterium]
MKKGNCSVSRSQTCERRVNEVSEPSSQGISNAQAALAAVSAQGNWADTKKDFPKQRLLIIITGGPGTGKSGVATGFLSFLERDDIVRLSYDDVKEKEFDRFGFDNETQKDRLNRFSLEEFYLMLGKAMWEGRTILTEYPFYQRHKPRLQELIDEYSYDAATIFLYTDIHTVYQRFINRNDGDRHPGHLLSRYHIEDFSPETLIHEKQVPDFEEFAGGIAHKEYDVGLGISIPVDVSDFSKISYEEIYQRIIDYY